MEQRIYSEKVLGAAIMRQRKRLKLNQADAGQLYNLDQTTVSSIENGAPGTRLETLLRMLAALDLEMIIRTKSAASADQDEDWS